MPVAIALAPAVIGAGAAIYGAHKAGQAQKEATRLSAQGNRDALAFQRQVSDREFAEEKRRYDEQQAQIRQQWDEYAARRQMHRNRADAVFARRRAATPRTPFRAQFYT